jgi:iron(III) transport system substrate-binding protein
LLRAGPIALVLVLLVLAGCGESEESAQEKGQEGYERVLEQIEGLQGKARMDKLAALAKQEGGRLDLYSTLAVEAQSALSDEFEEAYGVETSVYRATGGVTAERLSEENRAGFRGADATDIGGTEMLGLAREGLFLDYRPVAASGLLPDAVKEGWTANRYTRYTVGWNTDLVPPSRRPRSLEDLADPRWKGRIALEPSDADWYFTARNHLIQKEGMSPAEADRIFEGIAANSRVVGSHSLQSQLLAAGEFAMSPSVYVHHLREAASEKAPVAFEPLVGAVISRATGIGLLKSAKHPATAILYQEWVLTDGQEVLKKNNVDPSRKDLAGRYPGEIPLDSKGYLEAQEEWDARYEKLLRGRETIEDDG